jgi:Putative beta-barrel porin-2, OmpL-like. bbp2
MRLSISVSLAVMAGAVAGFLVLAAPGASAQSTTPPAAPKSWWDAVNLSGYLEAGVTGNFDAGGSNLNIGHAFTDKANQFLFNQGSLIFERPVDTSGGLDWGFRLQGMMGSDARYTHFLGELDYPNDQRIQFDLLEASVTVHAPYVTAGGEELKIGQFPTLLGAETIDPRGNYFYSHSYIFNFGLPLKDTGLMLVTHASPLVDLYTGLISGENTSLGSGDDNDAVAFEGGVGLNISDKLTILITTNLGPENPCVNYPVSYSCNSAMRYFGDAVITYKLNPALTSITELNIVHDDGPFYDGGGSKFGPTAGGAAQYLIYNWSDMLALVGRIEVFRDSNGFFVGAFPGNADFVRAEYGRPNTSFSASGGAPATYGELTVGVNIKPPVPDIFKGFVIRPEFRIDQVLGGPNAYSVDKFDVAHKKTQETLAVDAVLPF